MQVFAPDGRELAPAVIESTEGGDESSPTTTEGVEDAWGPLPEGLAISIMAPSLNLPPVGHSAETVAPETTGGTTDTEGSAAATVRGCVVEESATPGMATYRLVATLSDGTSAEETADVTAAEGIALVDFSASVDGAQATSVAAGQAFELVWHVTPATASGYQLVLDPGGVDVTSLTATGEGQYAVKEGISASASYTLTLKSADGVQLDQKQLAVTVSEPEELAPVSATLTVTPESVFAGEPVTITVTVNGTEDGATDATGVSIVGPDGAALAEGALSATHNPTEPGNNQYQVKINGEVKDIKTVYVRGFDSLYTGVGAAVTNADKGAFFGLEQDLAGNDLSIARQTEENVAQPLKLNFIDSFLKVYTVSTNSAEFAKFNPYRVNAIAIHPSNPDLVAIGASGALYLSTKDKEGKTVYPLVEAMPYRVDGDGTHASCKGTTQKGRNAKGTGKNPFAGLLQVCDLLFLPNGGLVMAWDGGIAYHTDVAAYHKGHKEGFNGWKGLLKKENMLTGHIVNDLFYDSQGQTVYVAADSGIFKVGVEAINADAPAFGVVGNLDKPYTVAVGADGTLYAGTADGLYRSTAGGSFEAVSGVTGPVYAIAEEASVATLYVGTAKGLVVLRNGQVSTTIADKIGEEVRAIAIDPSLHDTHIYVASKKGIYFSHGSKHGGVGEKHGADTDELPLPPTPPASAPEPPVESPEVPAGAAGANSHLIK
ncbi:MAG: hypothetical protein HYV03_01455 [Deltaproteobacteria bacterium]|nr:hypothetical protein [Deltaproteobacteria bacterium]